jgi:cytochrome c biogenesis protein
LRGQRFRVESRREGDATYIFADRYPWTQLATFVSHLALILFIAGGLVTMLTGFTSNLSIGEGATLPVFAVSDPDQIQVRVDETIGRFGEQGNALDFRSHLTLFRNGEEVRSGYTTVNNPLEYGGYRFHQAGFFPFGAQLRIRDAASGNTVFNETFPLEEATAAPIVTIADSAGNTLLRDTIVPTDLLPAASGAIVNVPGTMSVLWIGLAPIDDGDQWQLVAYDPQTAGGGDEVRLMQGDSAAIGKLNLTFDELAAIPSTVGLGVPGGGERVLAQLHDGPDGRKALTLIDGERPAMTLAPGEPFTVDGYEYTFEGQREFTGISVKRDRGAWFIWVATGLLLAGLAVTFYVPRRRLWLKLTAGETRVAALAEKSGGFERDMRTLARRLDVPVPPELQEER